MKVFVLNAGSSSLKAAYFESRDGQIERDPAWSANVNWSSLPARAKLEWTVDGKHEASTVEVDGMGAAATAVLHTAIETYGVAPDVVAHRVVHGLDESHCTIVDPRVRSVIERAAALAPLHNSAALAGIDAAVACFPKIPQAADFDTAFHTTLPPAAAAYALPYDWYAKRGLRRYGFHGISHRYCAQRTSELLVVDPASLRMVSAHLGNGCSLAAISGGKSVDTTMGFTPLDGLMMGSRSGSVDPGLVLHLLKTGAYTVDALDGILNTQSGLAGVSCVSEDIRDVTAVASAGDYAAQLALDMYVHRLRAAIAAMASATGGMDALSFTGGVGEHSAYIRERVCAGLEFLGIALRPAAAQDGADREIGTSASAVRLSVITAREEFAIARDVALLLADGRNSAAASAP